MFATAKQLTTETFGVASVNKPAECEGLHAPCGIDGGVIVV